MLSFLLGSSSLQLGVLVGVSLFEKSLLIDGVFFFLGLRLVSYLILIGFSLLVMLLNFSSLFGLLSFLLSLFLSEDLFLGGFLDGFLGIFLGLLLHTHLHLASLLGL